MRSSAPAFALHPSAGLGAVLRPDGVLYITLPTCSLSVGSQLEAPSEKGCITRNLEGSTVSCPNGLSWLFFSALIPALCSAGERLTPVTRKPLVLAKFLGSKLVAINEELERKSTESWNQISTCKSGLIWINKSNVLMQIGIFWFVLFFRFISAESTYHICMCSRWIYACLCLSLPTELLCFGIFGALKFDYTTVFYIYLCLII